MTVSPNDRARRTRTYLAADPTGHPCWQCGRPATSRDHIPPLALHHHQPGTGCCHIAYACLACNARDGQAITAELNRARALERRQRKAQRHGLLATHDIHAWTDA